jgi:hypothetical protein
MILYVLRNDRASVKFCGSSPGKCSSLSIRLSNNPLNASGCIISLYLLDSWVLSEEPVALSKSHRMRLHSLDVSKRRSRTADHMLSDWNGHFVFNY